MDKIDEQPEVDVALTRLGLQMPQLIIVAINQAEPGALMVRIPPFGCTGSAMPPARFPPPPDRPEIRPHSS